MSTEVVAALPRCDFCADDAHYDVRTIFGPWANVCETHRTAYAAEPTRLGTGIGQRLVITGDVLERVNADPEVVAAHAALDAHEAESERLTLELGRAIQRAQARIDAD